MSSLVTFAELALALSSDYESIFVIDADDDSYVEYLAEGDSKSLSINMSGDDFFSDVPHNAELLVHPEDRAYFVETLRKENVISALKSGGSFYLDYRLIKDGRPVYYSLKTIKSSDRRIIIGVQNIDERKRNELEKDLQRLTYGRIANALAGRYEAIYYVNIIDNSYREFATSDKYARLEVGGRGRDFFKETRENMQEAIYAEDLPIMLQAMDKETLLGQIKSSGKVYFKYRLILDGSPQYMSLIAVGAYNDHDHIIVAIENIDEATRREQAFEAAIGTAIDMANKDALTGVKNKHAYVNAEVSMDMEIKADPTLEFAITVCDINGLKNVNDTLGHTAGDQYIKDACMIICKRFKHSPVFRIGGDEFVVILQGNDYMERETLLSELSDILSENRKNGLVTVAYGMSEYISGTDNRTQDVFERADKLMYENKKAYKNAT